MGKICNRVKFGALPKSIMSRFWSIIGSGLLPTACIILVVGGVYSVMNIKFECDD